LKTYPLLVFLALLTLLVGCNPGRETESMTPTGEALSYPTQTEMSEINSTMPVQTQAAPKSVGAPQATVTSTACSGELTSANQEGPYYIPGSPQRSNLIEPGMPGIHLLLFGRVYDQDCNPISGVRLDFWQADANGEYDNQGYTLRGYVFSDEDGSYTLETIEPGRYPGRPPHIHVKVFSPDGRELLTTQIYFAGSEDSPDINAAPDLMVDYLGLDENSRQQVLFNFEVAR
jgi:protocatechuate 3,4-dioxygenase beta subunit